MKTFIGIKAVKAWPETKDGQAGWGVEYGDGYRSWSPASVFEAAYQEVENTDADRLVETLRSALPGIVSATAIGRDWSAGESTRLVQIREPDLAEARGIIETAMHEGAGATELGRLKEIFDTVADDEAKARELHSEAEPA